MAGNLNVTTNINDLKELAEFCIERGRESKTESKPETYLTPQELADKFNVSLVTIWNWDRKGITKPVRIGNAKRYRLSDVEKFLQER